MIRTWNQRPAARGELVPGGRLTLTSNTPVTTADVTAATSIYYTAYSNNLFLAATDGFLYLTPSNELSLALDSNSANTGYQQSGKNFDLFLYSDSGTLRLVSGPAWTNDTTRATSLTQLKGVYVNSGSMTAKYDATSATLTVADKTGAYVGTMRASANGQCEDSYGGANQAGGKRYLWNAYNRVSRRLGVIDTSTSWTYTTATWRQSQGAAGAKVEFVIGLALDTVYAQSVAMNINTDAGLPLRPTGIGVDSTSASSAIIVSSGQISGTNVLSNLAFYRGYPGIGYHYLAWLEYSQAVGTTTWYGDGGVSSDLFQSGLFAEIMA